MGLSWPSNKNNTHQRQDETPTNTNTNFNTQQFQNEKARQKQRSNTNKQAYGAAIAKREFENGAIVFEQFNSKFHVRYALKKSGIFTAGLSINHNNNNAISSSSGDAAAASSSVNNNSANDNNSNISSFTFRSFASPCHYSAIKTIASGYNHYLILTYGGTVYACGNNDQGQYVTKTLFRERKTKTTQPLFCMCFFFFFFCFFFVFY